jgi:hypothetical protein
MNRQLEAKSIIHLLMTSALRQHEKEPVGRASGLQAAMTTLFLERPGHCLQREQL